MPRRIGLIIYPGFQILDATGPIAAFEIANRLRASSYELRVISADGGMVSASAGIDMPSTRFGRAGDFDTVLAVGGDGSRTAMQCRKTITYLRQQREQSRRMGSVCSGAFLLAAAGLLKGRRATTHWRRAADLAARFPDIVVASDAIFVVDGPIWTSAGITAGIDLALAMIAADLGEAIAKAVAQEMVVYYRRPGGQSQFSALLDLGGEDGRFGGLLGWMRCHLSERLTIETLAEQAVMSPRNFSRAFTRALGQSPAKAVERLRVEAAKDRIESTSTPIERIAVEIGFNDPERMRRAFLRAFGQSPRAMRRLAGGSSLKPEHAPGIA